MTPTSLSVIFNVSNVTNTDQERCFNMSDFKGVFAILPSWGNYYSNGKEVVKGYDSYNVYIISGDFLGHSVVNQCKSPAEALARFKKYIEKTRVKYSSELDYFAALQSVDYGRGLCIPKALKEYVTTYMEEVGNIYEKEIEDLVEGGRYIPVKKKLRPIPRFNRVAGKEEQDVVFESPRSLFKVNQMLTTV